MKKNYLKFMLYFWFIRNDFIGASIQDYQFIMFDLQSPLKLSKCVKIIKLGRPYKENDL